MLIFICSMPRSGGTLLYQLTKEICEQNDLCRGRGFAKQSITSGVVKTEFCEYWMLDKVKNGAIAFGSYRDFRDVVLSLRDFYNRREQLKKTNRVWSIQEVLKYRPEILDSFYGWQDNCDIWFKFEDENFAWNVLEKVSDFLNILLTTEEKQQIIAKYSLVSNISRIKQQKSDMDAGNGSMLTKWHISPHQGQSRWKDALTRNDLERIENVGRDWLIEHGYG